jgi:hypothetical protein
MPDLMKVWLDMSCDTVVMGGRLTLFAKMLLDRLWDFRVSILT